MWIMVNGIEYVEDASIANRHQSNALGLVVECQEKAKELAARFSPLYGESAYTQAQSQKDEEGIDVQPTDSTRLLMALRKKLEHIRDYALVTHITEASEILQLLHIMRLKTVLLAGDIQPEAIIDLKNRLSDIKIIKALPVVDHSSIRVVKDYLHIVDAIELDTMDMVTKKIGGTGKTHDWNISWIIVQEYGWQIPIILAGGLCSDNIEKAIQTVRPLGVDVSTGVKNSRGILDADKLEVFTNKIRVF